jgi:hypothetical protein
MTVGYKNLPHLEPEIFQNLMRFVFEFPKVVILSVHLFPEVPNAMLIFQRSYVLL